MTQQALLLVNLGSPASTQVADVRRYLNQFLMDPYVIDLAWPLRRFVVSMILRKRPAASAHAYESIWWPEGSPLVVLGQRLQQAVQPLWPHGPVALAMRYGEPSMESVLCNLAQQGIQEVLLAPLYPQFADSTTTTVIEEAKRVIHKQGLKLSQRVLPPFYEKPEYLAALAASAEPYLSQGFDHVLLSYHGLPERHVRKADPSGGHCLGWAQCCEKATGDVLGRCYKAQCLRTSQGFAQAAGLRADQWSMAFQSRLGREKWIGPATDEVLEHLAAQGVKKLLVLCPAFVADCLETLEEIGERGKEQFVAAGGEHLELVPCLNDHPAWAQALVKLCQQAGK